MSLTAEPLRGWRWSSGERWGLGIGVFALLIFGANVEQRTALRRSPMTDLGVFSCAAGAVISGQNLYSITDWHGWHYQYPPALAILFVPLATPVPADPPILARGVTPNEFNTPWGYDIPNHRHFYGLHDENRGFFCIVAVWYLLSVALIFLSIHLLACALEQRGWRQPPPVDKSARRRWWWLRLAPVVICAGSLGTELSRGQVDILMLAAMALALYLAASKRELQSGFWLSLPATVKLFPALLLIYPVWRTRWRMLAGTLAGLLFALAILPMVALGPARTIHLYQVWFEVLAKPALGQGADTSRLRELTGLSGTDNQSLLAFVHNWRFHDMQREQRPPRASTMERRAVYAAGACVLLGILFVIGRPQPDSPSALLIIAGLFIGAAIAINPVSHNYYFILLLPLVIALLHRRFENPGERTVTAALLVFMLTDMAARLSIGRQLRDWGIPLLSLIFLMAAGAMTLRRRDQVTGEIVPREVMDELGG